MLSGPHGEGVQTSPDFIEYCAKLCFGEDGYMADEAGMGLIRPIPRFALSTALATRMTVPIPLLAIGPGSLLSLIFLRLKGTPLDRHKNFSPW